jgi:uncharacterized short protein YbdD (DUF466 family)
MSLQSIADALLRAWRLFRTATGDDAYERYVEHHTHAHPGEPLLSRTAFYDQRLQKKWSGVSRCC